MAQADIAKQNSPIPNDADPAETAEWLESLRSVLESHGPERVSFLLAELSEAAHRQLHLRRTDRRGQDVAGQTAGAFHVRG